MDKGKCIKCETKLEPGDFRVTVSAGTEKNSMAIALCMKCILESASGPLGAMLEKAKGFFSMFGGGD